MSTLLKRLVRLVTRWTRFMATPTGVLLPLAALLAILAIAGVWSMALGSAAVVVALVGVAHKLSHFVIVNQRLHAEIGRLNKRIDRIESKDLAKANRRIDRSLRRVEKMNTLVRETAAELRAEIAGSRLDDGDWYQIDAVLAGEADAPVLSFAVPGYNRPEKLAKALDSIIEQVEPTYADRVEVVITDDRSADRRATAVAHRYAQDHAFIGFRRNPENLGLERNLIECAKPCRGEYLWVFGNDDLLGPDALANLMPELEEGRFDIFLVDKDRISKTDEPVDFRPGTRPSETSGEYESILAMAEVTGLISSFGWISQVIRRRAPYMAVSPDAYYQTTLHPHIGMLLEAFPDSEVAFRAFTGVVHRTQDPRQRLAESAGRPEASYMAGGMERNARWFGAGYAAMLQRVVDRTDITPQRLAMLNEAQWHEGSMLDWIAENWQWGLDNGLTLDAELLDDAERLFRATGRRVPQPS